MIGRPEPPPSALTPAERLEASRARLREALESRRGGRPVAPSAANGDREGGEPSGSLLDRSLRRIRRHWARHPMRPAAHVLRHAAGPLIAHRLAPVARERPAQLLAVAAGAGALLAWLRPWRLLPRAAGVSLLISILLPRRLLWQELLSSNALQRVLGSETLAAWLTPADGAPRDDADPAPPATAPATSGPEPVGPEVLHRTGQRADAAQVH